MKRLFLAHLPWVIAAQTNPRLRRSGRDRSYPYSRYAFTRRMGHRSPAYKNWSTAQLQQRRLDLYGMNPLTQTREACLRISITASDALTREIKAIEVELNWRYDHA